MQHLSLDHHHQSAEVDSDMGKDPIDLPALLLLRELHNLLLTPLLFWRIRGICKVIYEL